MLSCHDLAHKVASDYVDKQLRWHERAKVRLHLAICDNCRRFIKQLKLVRGVIRQHDDGNPVDVPTDAQLQQLAKQLHATAQQKKNSS